MDVLYVLINGNISSDVLLYIIEILDKYPKICHYQFPFNIDHGPALNVLLGECLEELVLLIEEDGLIFKKGEVDKHFKSIEQGDFDLIGSSRGSTSDELIKIGQKRWHTDDQPHFWPNFLFCKKSDLIRTNCHFQAMTWYKDDYIKELDHVVEADIIAADTFVWTSMQLRELDLKIKIVPQYHSVIEDIEDYTQIRGVFDRRCPWVHIGSLSGWQHTLFDDLPDRIGDVGEWERRAAFWLMCWEDAKDQLSINMVKFHCEYKKGIDRLIDQYTLSLKRIELRAKLYRSLLTGQ